MGIGGALMWPAILGMTYELLPEEKAGLAGGHHHRRRRARQRDRAADRRRPHRRAELALDLLPQRADRRSSPSSSPSSWSTSRSPKPSDHRIDYPGIAALSVGLVSLLIALDQVDDWGWGDPRVVGLLAWRRSLLVAFVPIERRAGTHALVPREVMRNESFTASCLAILFMSATFFASLLYLPQFMEKQLGYSPLEAGVGMLPFLATFAVVSFVAGPLYDRLGAKRLAVFGAACITVAPFLFSQVDGGSGYGSLIPGMVVLGLGVGSFYPTATTAGVTSVDESQTSLAGGIVYMFQIAGGSIGLGLTTTVFSVADPALRRRRPGRLPARRGALAGRLPDRAALRRRAAVRAPRPSRPPSELPLLDQDVFAGAVDEYVFAGFPAEHVGAGAAKEPVVAWPAEQLVVTGAAHQNVVAGTAIKDVWPPHAGQHVVAEAADQSIAEDPPYAAAFSVSRFIAGTAARVAGHPERAARGKRWVVTAAGVDFEGD